MNRFSAAIVGISVLAGLLLAAPPRARAGWELYDDFSSGSIDPSRWNVEITGGAVSVVHGRAKLVLKDPGPRNVWLYFTRDVQSIKGVQARVRIAKASGDLRAVIGGYAASTPEGHPVWQTIQLRPQLETIWSNVAADDAVNGDFLFDLFLTTFRKPVALAGKWFTISTRYPNPNKYIFSVSGQGTQTFVLPRNTLAEGPVRDLLIGLRSKDGTGTGTVYFDNVKVFR